MTDGIDTTRRRLLLAAAIPALLSALPAPALAPMASSRVPEPPAGFAAGTSADEVAKDLDLRGRTVLVTGATSGIGLELLRVLAGRGAHVIGTYRRAEAAAPVRALSGRIDLLPLDLADFASVRACAAQVRTLAQRLDVLVCNAGIVLPGLEQVGGLEKSFVVNHLGHFLLVQELLPAVLAAAQGRVVVLGSGDHRRAPAGGIQFDDLSGRSWDARYAHSKLANGLFSAELARRLAGTAATSNCVSPGHTRTDILRRVGNGYRDDARTVGAGAATPCYVAVHPAIARTTGAYLADFRASEQSAYQQDARMARRLWQISEQLVAGSGT